VTFPIRRVAGALTVFESFWAAFIMIQDFAPFCPPTVSCPWPSQFLHSPVMLILVAALLVVGVIGFWGASVAYPVGAALSGITLIAMGYSAWGDSAYAYLQMASQLELIGAGLAAAALVANVIGVMKRSGLSEQANPMNLPVFG
jgi:hypothetical protein